MNTTEKVLIVLGVAFAGILSVIYMTLLIWPDSVGTRSLANFFICFVFGWVVINPLIAYLWKL